MMHTAGYQIQKLILVLDVDTDKESISVFQAALLALQEENMEASSIKHTYFLRSLGKMSPSLTAQQIHVYQTSPRWQAACPLRS